MNYPARNLRRGTESTEFFSESIIILCDLCVSAVNYPARTHHRATENTVRALAFQSCGKAADIFGLRMLRTVCARYRLGDAFKGQPQFLPST